jgi:hypothetical protein
MEDSK